MKKIFLKIWLLALSVSLLCFGANASAYEDCGDNFSAVFSYEGVISPSSTTNITIPINSDFRTLLSLTAEGADDLEAGENVDIVLVMDRSGSMATVVDGVAKIDQAKVALDQVVSLFQAENNPQHRLSLVTYNSSVTLDQSLTSNYGSVSNAINSFSAGGSTNIGGALTVAANHLANNGNPDSKKFIVLASDGVHNTGTPVRQGIDSVEDGITVYSVGIGDPSYYDENILRAVAGAGTGEGSYYSSSVADLVGTFESIIRDILTPFRPENINMNFFQLNTDKFTLIDTDPDSTSVSGGQIAWENFGSMTNEEIRDFLIDFRQAGGYGLGLDLNEAYIEVTYDLFGRSCYEQVPIEVLKIDNLPQCTGTVPARADICSGDDVGLTIDSPNILVSSCSSSKKCEYVCEAGYEYYDGACVIHAACGDLQNEEWCRTMPSFSTSSPCAKGFLSDGPVANGAQWNWICSGIFGGNSVMCSSKRICPHDWTEVNP